MINYIRPSIRGKLLLSLMLAGSIPLLLAAIGFTIHDGVSIRHSLFERLQAQASILAANTLSALIFEDPRAASLTLSSLENDAEILAAAIYNANGELFADYFRSGQHDVLPESPPGAGSGMLGRHAYTGMPVRFVNEELGIVLIISSASEWRKRLRETLIISLGLLLISLLAAFLISRRLQSLVSEPLLKLAETTRRISRERNFNLRAQRLSNDEIGSLVDDFNDMLQQIQVRDHKLEGHRQDLEDQVQARTRELLDLTRQLEHQAFHDTLTGLANRALFDRLLNQAIELAMRDRHQLAVLFLDLDRFKTINDTLGHSVGDQLLTSVAERFRIALRRSDSIARLGGDEFAVLINELKHPEGAAEIARKLIDLMASPFEVEDYKLHLSTSLGICLYPDDGEDAETLLKNADAAMYRSKELGRNRYEFYSADMNARAMRRLSVENRLRRALKQGELQCWYQPRFDTRSERIVALECLVRWLDPNEGLVLPGEFVTLAEDCGLITQIDEQIMQIAFREVLGWYGGAKPDIRVSVNLSPTQFIRQDINQVVEKILQETGFPPDCLELEITENVLGPNYRDMSKVLTRFQDLGIRIAIDDFGTGYSSLGRLKQLPIDILKIDQSFIRYLGVDDEDEALTLAIIEMAHNLKLDVVAEGVETETQYRMVTAMRCSQAQGFFLGRPLPAEDTAKLLEPPYPSAEQRQPQPRAEAG